MYDITVPEEQWRIDAACRTIINPDTMFPNFDRHDEVDKARAVCAGCPLAAQRECLAAAIESGDKWSMSGAMTPAERKKWRHARDA